MSIGMVLHSGGPTPVINASLLGVIEEARLHPEITGLLGVRFGIDGLLSQDFADLFTLGPDRLAAIGRAPSSALGSSRRYVGEESVETILRRLATHRVRYLFLTGGNGSMGAAARI